MQARVEILILCESVGGKEIATSIYSNQLPSSIDKEYKELLCSAKLGQSF